MAMFSMEWFADWQVSGHYAAKAAVHRVNEFRRERAFMSVIQVASAISWKLPVRFSMRPLQMGYSIRFRHLRLSRAYGVRRLASIISTRRSVLGRSDVSSITMAATIAIP